MSPPILKALAEARAEQQQATSSRYFADIPEPDRKPARLFSEVQWLSAAANREKRDGAGWTQAIELEGDSAVIRRIENRREVSRRAMRFYLDAPDELAIVETPTPPPAFEPAPSIQAAAATALAAMDRPRKSRAVPRAAPTPPPKATRPVWVAVAIVVGGLAIAALVVVVRGSL